MMWHELSPSWQDALRRSLKLEAGEPEATQLAKVDSLQLRGRDIKDLVPVALLPHLRLLVITNTSVADLSPLAAVTTLQKLWFRSSKKVTDLSPLDAMTWLQELQLHDTGVKAKAIKEFAARHPDCLVDTGR